MSRARPASRRPAMPAGGFSLVELMVALVIGLAVVTALLTAFLASGRSSRHTQAMAQITEDGRAVLALLRTQLAMAGYSQPVGVDGSGGFVRLLQTGNGAVTQVIKGCDGAGFSNPALAIDALACAPVVAGAPDAVALVYEADTSNSVLSASGVPLDCLGNTLSATAPGGTYPSYYQAYNRFYIGTSPASPRNALFCRGPGAAGAQALVENIADLQITYGLASAANPRQVVRYATAPAMAGVGAADWALVVTVRVCVVVASVDEVADAVTPFWGCDVDAAAKVPTDKRLYRAFTSTIVLNNRVQPA